MPINPFYDDLNYPTIIQLNECLLVLPQIILKILEVSIECFSYHFLIIPHMTEQE